MRIEELIELLQEIQRSSPRAIVVVPMPYDSGYTPIDLARVIVGRARIDEWDAKRLNEADTHDKDTLSVIFLNNFTRPQT